MAMQARSPRVAPGDPLRQLQDDDERSIGAAARATLWFVAIVVLLIWAGVSDAAPAGTASPTHCTRAG